MQGPKTHALYEQARAVMPLGVSSNYRYWGDDHTPVTARGKGGYIYDPDGRRYIDYRLGFGPVILGHGYPTVVERVVEALADGTIFATTHPWEVRVAERITTMCPGVEQVRFANSGTEATMHAIRVARAYTGREKVIKFEGQYHGMYDYVLFTTSGAGFDGIGPADRPTPRQMSQGIPCCIRDLIITLPYNDFELFDRTVRRQGHDIAAVIVEPIVGNVASIEPKPGWLELIRHSCDEQGIVMIMDEVKTGFRIAPGGAQEVYGIRADLVTYAKAMGNGFPIAAFGGRREVMAVIGPGKTYHGGTYCGNIVGTAAADATLELLADGQVLKSIAERGTRLQQGLSAILTNAGIPHVISGPPAMFGIILTEEESPGDLRAWLRSNGELYERIVMALIERGAMPDPDGREPWFLCYEHSERDIDDTLNWFEDSVTAVRN